MIFDFPLGFFQVRQVDTQKQPFPIRGEVVSLAKAPSSRGAQSGRFPCGVNIAWPSLPLSSEPSRPGWRRPPAPIPGLSLWKFPEAREGPTQRFSEAGWEGSDHTVAQNVPDRPHPRLRHKEAVRGSGGGCLRPLLGAS